MHRPRRYSSVGDPQLPVIPRGRFGVPIRMRTSSSSAQNRTVACLWAVLCAGTDVVAAGPEETLEITGIVRDFRERTVDGGHPDFEQIPLEGYRLYTGNVAASLDDNGKPVFTGEGVGPRAKRSSICIACSSSQ